MIRNLDPDPNALLRRYAWSASVTRRDDGKWTYTGNGNSYMGSCAQSVALSAPVGHVIVLIAKSADAAFATSKIWAADELLDKRDGDMWIKAARIMEINRTHELTISACTNGVTILGSGLYTPDDWDAILDLYTSGVLPYPWIAGEYLPLAGGGYALVAFIHTPSEWRWRHDTQPATQSVFVRLGAVAVEHDSQGRLGRTADLRVCGRVTKTVRVFRTAIGHVGPVRQDAGVRHRVRQTGDARRHDTAAHEQCGLRHNSQDLGYTLLDLRMPQQVGEPMARAAGRIRDRHHGQTARQRPLHAGGLGVCATDGGYGRAADPVVRRPQNETWRHRNVAAGTRAVAVFLHLEVAA